jgi:hypothetical protein
MQIDKEQETPIVQACSSKRWLPQFHYQREEAVNSLKTLNQKGHEQNPDRSEKGIFISVQKFLHSPKLVHNS